MDQPKAQNQSDSHQKDQDRPLRACVECRKKRARCDGTDPSKACGHCVRTKKPCVYQDIRRRSAKNPRRRVSEDIRPADAVLEALKADSKWSGILGQVNRGKTPPPAPTPAPATPATPATLAGPLPPVAKNLPPAVGWLLPAAVYSPLPAGYSLPANGYSTPANGYSAPVNGYSSPAAGKLPPANSRPRAPASSMAQQNKAISSYGTTPSQVPSGAPFPGLSLQQQRQQQQQVALAMSPVSAATSPISNASGHSDGSGFSNTSSLSNASSLDASKFPYANNCSDVSGVSNLAMFYPPTTMDMTPSGNTINAFLYLIPTVNIAPATYTSEVILFPTLNPLIPSSSIGFPAKPVLEDSCRWTKVQVLASTALDLVSLFFTLGYYPVLHRDPFLEDFLKSESGLDYCSPALVCAILALSCKRTEGLETNIMLTKGVKAQAFYDEAIQLLEEQEGLPRSLPDCQATTLLTLYQLAFGEKALPAELAKEAVEHSLAYWDLTAKMDLGDAWHQYSRHLALCSAVSLERVIAVFAAQSANQTETTEALSEETTNITLTGPIIQSLESWAMNAPIDNTESALSRVMAVKFFEATEIIHKAFRFRPTSNLHRDDLLEIYGEIMTWYEGMGHWSSQMFAKDVFGGFLQLYYYFCTLSVWHSFLRNVKGTTWERLHLDSHASSMCDNASQGIFDFSLNLCHESPYLQSVPYLWPQIMFAAAKAQLKILGAVRAVPVPNCGTLQLVETQTLYRRGYVLSGIVKLREMQSIYPRAADLSLELEEEYTVILNAASRAMQLG